MEKSLHHLNTRKFRALRKFSETSHLKLGMTHPNTLGNLEPILIH